MCDWYLALLVEVELLELDLVLHCGLIEHVALTLLLELFVGHHEVLLEVLQLTQLHVALDVFLNFGFGVQGDILHAILQELRLSDAPLMLGLDAQEVVVFILLPTARFASIQLDSFIDTLYSHPDLVQLRVVVVDVEVLLKVILLCGKGWSANNEGLSSLVGLNLAVHELEIVSELVFLMRNGFKQVHHFVLEGCRTDDMNTVHTYLSSIVVLMCCTSSK